MLTYNKLERRAKKSVNSITQSVLYTYRLYRAMSDRLASNDLCCVLRITKQLFSKFLTVVTIPTFLITFLILYNKYACTKLFEPTNILY